MMLLLFLDSVRSERELMRIIPERLDCMISSIPANSTRFVKGSGRLRKVRDIPETLHWRRVNSLDEIGR
jgi:hypothetical protein